METGIFTCLIWLVINVFYVSEKLCLAKIREDIRVYDLKSCPDEVPLELFDMRNVTLSVTGPGIASVNGYFTVVEFEVIDKVNVELMKCASRFDVDSCEKITEVKVTDACEKVTEDGQIWSSIIKSIKPKLFCPINKKTYYVEDGQFDVKAAKKLLPAMMNSYWKIKLRVYVKNELKICFQLVLGVQIFVERGNKKKH